MTAATQLVDTILADPLLTFAAGITVAATIIALDLETGISLKLPGRRRLTAAGFIALASASQYVLRLYGVQGVIDQLARDIISFGVVAVIIAWLFRDRGMI